MIWNSESERISIQKCTPIGYTARGVADILCLCAVILLIAAPLTLAREAIGGTFLASHFWLLAAPFALWIAAAALYRFAWTLGCRRGYRYDCERQEASWVVMGKRQTYKGQGDI
jgi:hypothetical protein